MIVVLKRGSTQEQIDEVLAELQRLGVPGRLVRSTDKPLIHVVSGDAILAMPLQRHERVQALVRTRGPRHRRQGRRFYPYHFINWCIAALLLLGTLVLLSGLLPPGLGEPVDLRRPPASIGPPWYFRGLDEFLGLFPAHQAWLSWLLVGLIWAVILFVPSLDRSAGRKLRQRWLVVGVGALAVIGALYLSLRGIVV
jgi:quinol-cytochrome oxidoreductase complex cytochrome b subunit